MGGRRQVAASLMLVVGTYIVSARGEDPARDTRFPVASPASSRASTAMPPPDRYQFGGVPPRRGPTQLNARKISGFLVRGEVLLIDVRPGRPPDAAGPIGQAFTYAFGCLNNFDQNICITTVLTGTSRDKDMIRVSRVPGATEQSSLWPNMRGQCCISFTALAAPQGAVSATLTYPNGYRAQAQRFEGLGWPFPLFLALGPRGGVFGPKSGSLIIELEDGSTVGSIA